MAIQQLQPLPVRDLSGGMISNIADCLLPTSVARQSLNLHYDLLGKATQRYGTTLVGTVVEASQTCRGLAPYVSSDGSTNRLIAVFNKNTYHFDGTTWTNFGATSTTAKLRMATFLNMVFSVGGGTTTRTWAGSGAWGTTNVSGAPTGQVLAVYKEKMFIAGDATYPDRVYFSSVPSTTNTITWTSTDWIDVNPEDGDNITGLWANSDLLFIFKERGFYTYNNSTVNPIVSVGTTSQESIAECKGFVFFFNPGGIFVTSGAYPREISRPIYDWIANISPSFYTEVSAFCDDDHYFCAVGNVTKGGRTYTNVWLVYTISSQDWAVFSFADSFRAMCRYVVPSTGVISYVGGDTDGAVQTFFSGNTDNGTAIQVEYESKELEFESRATTKQISELAAYVTNGVGMQIMIAEDNQPYRTVGKISDIVTILKGINVKGHYFRVKLAFANSSTPIVFDGYEILRADSLGLLTRN